MFSAVITCLMIPKIILISFKKKLFDPITDRKVHTGVVPRLGGVAFVPAVIIAIALSFGLLSLVGGHDILPTTAATSPRLSLCLCALLLLYFEGITDDLVGIGYRTKFVLQFLCAGAIVASGIWVNQLYGLLGIGAIPWYVGKPLSMVVIVFVINAINLIDGIDGLASGLSSIALLFLGCLFFYTGEYISAGIAFATLGTLLPFFYYNVFGKAEQRRKIFMGDCGSQCIGLLLALLAIRFGMHRDGTLLQVPCALVVSFSLLMIPCLDIFRVMLGRIRRGCNPFLPDRTHIHHELLAIGMSHRTAMVVIVMLATFFALLNILLIGDCDINLILLLDILLWTGLNLWLTSMIRHKP